MSSRMQQCNVKKLVNVLFVTGSQCILGGAESVRKRNDGIYAGGVCGSRRPSLQSVVGGVRRGVASAALSDPQRAGYPDLSVCNEARTAGRFYGHRMQVPKATLDRRGNNSGAKGVGTRSIISWISRRYDDSPHSKKRLDNHARKQYY
jgi:hypothetical protein